MAPLFDIKTKDSLALSNDQLAAKRGIQFAKSPRRAFRRQHINGAEETAIDHPSPNVCLGWKADSSAGMLSDVRGEYASAVCRTGALSHWSIIFVD